RRWPSIRSRNRWAIFSQRRSPLMRSRSTSAGSTRRAPSTLRCERFRSLFRRNSAADLRHRHFVHAAAGEVEPAVGCGDHVPDDATARRDVPLQKTGALRIEAYKRVWLHSRLAVPDDSVPRDGDAVRMRLAPTGRGPLLDSPTGDIQPAEIATGKVGVVDGRVAGQRKPARTRLGVRQDVLVKLKSGRVDPRDLVRSELAEIRHAFAV